MYSFVRNLNERQNLIAKNGKYFVASYANVNDEPEVLVFEANANGKIENWLEVDGGRGYKSITEFMNKCVRY